MFRYSSKIIVPNGVLFPQKGEKRRERGRKEGSSGEDTVNYISNKQEELPMNAIIPHKNLKAREKKIIIEANQKLYRRSSRKEKTIILNELENITGYSRKYIIHLLNIHNRVIKRCGKLVIKADIKRSLVSRRGRKRVYNDRISRVLFKIWRIAGGISSKHLKVFIEENYDTLICPHFLEKLYVRVILYPIG